MQVHQNTNQQHWGFPSDLSNSNGIGSPQFRVDAFSKHSQSFIERNTGVSFNSLIPSATSVTMEPSTFSDWGSSNGKLDWYIRGYELNKMRKSYSFGLRNRSSTSTAASNIDDQDVLLIQETWVNSLANDVPATKFDRYYVEVED